VDPKRAGVKAFNVPPFSSCGKWYFTDVVAGKNYVASAEFVGSRNIIMTAAHCVHHDGTDKWYTNYYLLFKRGYADGGGQWITPCNMWIWKNYWNSGSRNNTYDYAFIYMFDPPSAAPVALTLEIWSARLR